MIMATIPSCKRDKDENICDGAHPVNANFKVYENSSFPLPDKLKDLWLDIPSDTFLNGTEFIADEPDAKYEWRIGIKSYSTRSVTVNFQTASTGSVIPITLIVEKQPNKACFPDDDGKDSITRSVVKNGVSPFFKDGTYVYASPGNPGKMDTFRILKKVISASDYIYFYKYPNFIDSMSLNNYSGTASYKQQVGMYTYTDKDGKWTQFRDRWIYKGNNTFDIYMEWYPKETNPCCTDRTDLKKSQSIIATKIN